jgi:hypothetical protein
LPTPAVPAEKLASRYDPAKTGTISGEVLWTDDLREVKELSILLPNDGKTPDKVDNPNKPIIDPESGRIEGALVFLRKVDLAISKPWTHAPVSVVFTDTALEVRQGAAHAEVGIVQLGDSIACSATVERNFSLVARGVRSDGEFFSLPLPKPNIVTNKKLDKTGAVELSCGRGRYWLREYLWVSDHPYATVTNADGSFEMKHVPEGNYEIVSWMPSWHILRNLRNPESGEVVGLKFEPPAEQKRAVTVTVGGDPTTIEFSWSSSDFRRREND